MCVYVSFEQGLDVLEFHLRVDLDGVDFTVFGEDGDAHLLLQVRLNEKRGFCDEEEEGKGEERGGVE